MSRDSERFELLCHDEETEYFIIQAVNKLNELTGPEPVDKR